MKKLITLSFLFFITVAYSQTDSVRPIEPGQQTSYDNKDLLLISLAGLALLLAIYFLFRRARKTRN